MNFTPARLTKYRQVLGIAVAGIILAVIFVPLQSAEAYTSDLTLPNASPSAVPTSAVGSTFRVTITPAPGELISVATIQLILDNGTPNVKSATFGPNGHRTDGSPTLARGNLDITIPTPTIQGYGYGFGYSAAGVTFSSNTYSLVSPGNQFIAGNTIGYSNPVGNFVTGLVGDGTKQIIIEGKLNTAVMTPGPHTLDVLVNTGAGGNGIDKIVTPQLSFTTIGNSSVASSTVAPGNQTVEPNVPGVPPGKLKVKVNSNGGQIAVQKTNPSGIQGLLNANLFTSLGTGNIASFNIGSSSGNTIGDVFEIDTSGLVNINGQIEVTVPYDETLLPPGFNENNVKLFHWTGTAWEDVTVSVDTTNNTVTGLLNSLSPVVSGYTSAAPGTSTTTVGTTTGGGGAGVDLTLSYPDSYFETHPLAKVQLRNSAILNAAGNSVASVKAGEQVTISTAFKNYRQADQNYALIILVLNQDKVTSNLDWITGVLEGAGTADGSSSWVAAEPGSYTVRIFTWDGISASPAALSEVTQMSIQVT